MVPVPGGYSQGHKEYEGCQRRANEANDPRAPVLSARTICTRRNIDCGRRAEHAYGPDLKVGVVVVARRANHIIVVADTRARLGEYLRIARYVSCNNQNRGGPGLACQESKVASCDSPKSGSNEKTKSPAEKTVERCHVIPSAASVEKEKKRDDNAPPHNVMSKIRFCA
jgi:hypothetical protein